MLLKHLVYEECYSNKALLLCPWTQGTKLQSDFSEQNIHVLTSQVPKGLTWYIFRRLNVLIVWSESAIGSLLENCVSEIPLHCPLP